MKKISKRELSQITKMIEKEYPEDYALQQVHIARQIVRREAELNEMGFGEYVKMVAGTSMKRSHSKTAHQ